MRSRNRFSPLAIFLALGLSACSGAGGGTAPSAPGAPQQPSQPGTETATQTYTLRSAASSYAFPPLSGFSGSVAMPAATVPAGTTLQLTSALQPPAGGPTLQDVHTFAQSAGTLNVYFFTTIRLSATITFQSLPGFSLTLPGTINPAGQQFFYAVSTSTPNSGAVLSFGTQGPATVAGQTVTFAPSNTPLTLLAGKSYIVAFYATSLTASPSPSPSPQEKIYVTEPSTNAVAIYPLDGSRPSTITNGLFDPVSVGVDQSGNIAVANNALDVPQYPASAGTPFNVISGPIAPNSNLNVTPRAVAVNASGTIYVLNTYSDGSANITSYLPTGQQFKPLIPLASGEVVTIAVDDNGKIYVDRAFSASITVFDSNGNQLSQFFPPSLAVSVAANSNGSRIYLTSDFPSARINTFDAKGKQMPPTILLKNGIPIAVAVDPNGNIFVRSSTGELTSYSSNGTPIKPTIEGLGGLGGIAVR